MLIVCSYIQHKYYLITSKTFGLMCMQTRTLLFCGLFTFFFFLIFSIMEFRVPFFFCRYTLCLLAFLADFSVIDICRINCRSINVTTLISFYWDIYMFNFAQLTPWTKRISYANCPMAFHKISDTKKMWEKIWCKYSCEPFIRSHKRFRDLFV